MSNSDTAINVDSLGKRYELGVIHHDRLAEKLTAGLWQAAGWARRLWSPGKEADSRENASPYASMRRLDTQGIHALPQTDSPDAGPPMSDHIWALRDASFSVARGEVLGIVGRNGAGKSTLLKILTGITRPTEGRAWLDGRVGSLLEVGTGFHPELTGRENIFLNGAILGMKRAEIAAKFDEIVEFAEIGRFIDTPVKRYSSGMYVRLAFAVAAHLEPEILLIDEVLAVGDAAFQKKCLGRMDDVSKQGRTVLFVSHNMFSLQTLCSRGILIDSGRVAIDDDIAVAINAYLGKTGRSTGEVCFDVDGKSRGRDRLQVKAVRIVSQGRTTGEVPISDDFRVEVDYWNLEPDARRSISIHLRNSMGVCVLTSGNLPSVSIEPDPWYSKPYPRGLFRTSCTVPGGLLNDDEYTISLFIVGASFKDDVARMPDLLAFEVVDDHAMQREYTGKWAGAVRPHLHWQTEQMA